MIETVSKAIETPIGELRPLYEVLDPDALDQLFNEVVDRDELTRNGTITFRYKGLDVSVSADGRIVVSRPGPDRP